MESMKIATKTFLKKDKTKEKLRKLIYERETSEMQQEDKIKKKYKQNNEKPKKIRKDPC